MDKDIQYIEMFNQLEQHFRKITQSDYNVSFNEMVYKLRENYLIRRYSEELREHAQLRNVISHKRGTDYFAFPSDLAVVSIRKIKDLFTKPQPLYNLIKSKPIIFEKQTKILEVLKIIKEMGYSQFPIYDKDKFLGLLTTNSISLWISNIITSSGEIIEDINNVTVEEIIKFNEPFDQASFIAKNTTVNEFLDLMLQSPHVKIWIMTEDGRKDFKPLKVVTPYDYDVLIENITK